MKNMLIAQTTMFAMLARDGGCPGAMEVPTRGMPHSGLIPTGAEREDWDRPFNTEGSLR